MDKKSEYYGRMNDPTVAARIKGICGDEIEFYLYIVNDRIKEIKFYTENGCSDTLAAGHKTAGTAVNQTITEVLSISPGQIIKALPDKLREEGRHCAILAVTTLHKAIASYLLQA